MIQYVTVNRRDVTGAYHIQQYFSQVVATHVQLLSFIWSISILAYAVFYTHAQKTVTGVFPLFISKILYETSFKEDIKYSTLIFFFILMLKGLGKEFASVMHFKTYPKAGKFMN